MSRKRKARKFNIVPLTPPDRTIDEIDEMMDAGIIQFDSFSNSMQKDVDEKRLIPTEETYRLFKRARKGLMRTDWFYSRHRSSTKPSATKEGG